MVDQQRASRLRATQARARERQPDALDLTAAVDGPRRDPAKPRLRGDRAPGVGAGTTVTAGIERRSVDPFEPALAGTHVRLVCSDGRELEQPVDRWHAPADIDDEWLLQRCCGPTVDMGCGPGRLLAALTERGVPALGVDRSPRAVRQSHSRGGPALHRDVFDPLPGEGKWSHVLLADGNLGIGGDPAALLHRCTHLIHPGGTALVEAEARPLARSGRS